VLMRAVRLSFLGSDTTLTTTKGIGGGWNFPMYSALVMCLWSYSPSSSSSSSSSASSCSFSSSSSSSSSE
jgi:hypothetical protein